MDLNTISMMTVKTRTEISSIGFTPRVADKKLYVYKGLQLANNSLVKLSN